MKTKPTTPYTAPVACLSGKESYVYIRFWHIGKWHDLKRREGLNRIKDKRIRKKEAEALCDARHEWLKEGWNPITDPTFRLRNILTSQGVTSMQFCEALDFALEKKSLAKKSRQGYSSQLNHVKEMAKKTGHSLLQVSQIKRVHIMDLMDRLKKDRKMSHHAYNKYLDTIRAMFTVLETWQAVEFNPASKIEHLKVAESNKFIPLDEKEKALITKHLYTKHYRFYVYIQLLYHTGIRPKEILALRISDFDLKRQLITIAPNLEEENSKTTKVRHVAISNELLPFLYELYLHKYPSNYYVFGSPFEGERAIGVQDHKKGASLE